MEVTRYGKKIDDHRGRSQPNFISERFKIRLELNEKMFKITLFIYLFLSQCRRVFLKNLLFRLEFSEIDFSKTNPYTVKIVVEVYVNFIFLSQCRKFFLF